MAVRQPDRLAVAVKFLAQKPRFAAELELHLADCSDDERSALLRQLKPYLNDTLTLDTYLSAHEGRSAVGRDRMRMKLVARGCPTDLLEGALAELPPETERAQALLTAQKRDLSPKSARFLLSRGFDEDTVRDVIES